MNIRGFLGAVLGAGIVMAILFSIKFWNNISVANHAHSTGENVSAEAKGNVCEKVQAAYLDSTGSHHYQACSFASGKLEVDVWSSSEKASAEPKLFTDDNVGERMGSVVCETFIKPHPEVKELHYSVLADDKKTPVYIFDLTLKSCNLALERMMSETKEVVSK